MLSFKKITNISGLLVFLITAVVFIMTAERTGSLWDCGEFILGAHKLQVVHPPGAGLFILIGRMFAWVAEILSDNPENIAFAVNIMSGLCTAAAAMFVSWTTSILGKMALVGRDSEPSEGENLAFGFAGMVAGLATAFCTSIWFSAVEGEVYAMSLMFSAFTIWAAFKWYHLPDNSENDRWLIFSLFVSGLSMGVHLLSLLTLPAIGLLYYYKKYDNHTWKGTILSVLGGLAMLLFVMKFVIVGIPSLWKNFEIFCVNSLGLPIHSGLVPTILALLGLGYYLLRLAHRKKSQLIQHLTMVAILMVVAYTTTGIVVVRANADTPVNMNTPDNVTRLIPYLNREQYGERPLIRGPHYMARPYKVDKEERYTLVNGKYVKNDEKFDYVYRDADKILLPRIGHYDRVELHDTWRNYLMGSTSGKPGMAYNLKFMSRYQIGWMYLRYFMWNFAGRQNSDQGFFPWDHRSGHWISGIDFIDEMRLHNMDELPDAVIKEQSRNKYYLLPFIFGLIGLLFHFSKKKNDFVVVLLLFLITGLGITFYSNPPPNEPRERDYIFVGSFMMYCVWMGFAVLAIFQLLRDRLNMKGIVPAIIGGVLVLSAPLIMLAENYDDRDRSEHFASRDYAANFLNSVDENAIIFTYGDNDTYPLWYAQEVENIRTDVRVVNLSLIQVDWYIEKLRNKVNNSPPIKLTINTEGYTGKSLNQIFFPEKNTGNPLNLEAALKAMNVAGANPSWPNRNIFLPIDESKIRNNPIFDLDSLPVTDLMMSLPESTQYLTKDEIAILDVIASNIYERPIYFAVTCKNEKLMRLNDYMQLEGLALRVIPVRSQSDRTLAIYGSGRIATDKAYENIMTKWKWGNFDKVDTHIDKSYMAEVQAMKYTMLRTALGFLYKGDKAKASEIANKYFEAFPNFNFRYDAGNIPFINVLVQAEDFESAKKHIEILATETADQADFLLSLDTEDVAAFGQDLDMTVQGLNESVSNSTRVNDEAFATKIKELVGDKAERLSQIRGLLN